jgi:aldose 1-epimerase
MESRTPDDSIAKKPFGALPDGRDVDLYHLTNDHGMRASITTYGGIVTSLTAPDRNGRFADVVLGFDDLEGYLAGHPYFGAIIGRYGNRIAGGSFDLDHQTYAPTTGITCTVAFLVSISPCGRLSRNQSLMVHG